MHCQHIGIAIIIIRTSVVNDTFHHHVIAINIFANTIVANSHLRVDLTL